MTLYLKKKKNLVAFSQEVNDGNKLVSQLIILGATTREEVIRQCLLNF
jgi:hypothetical protein